MPFQQKKWRLQFTRHSSATDSGETAFIFIKTSAWLHLGFWIKEHPKMSYKNQYRPCQLLIDGWQEFNPHERNGS
jgi:hypothetical protein